MNKVILMGRLVRDPEIRQTSGEESTVIARYTLAVARSKRQMMMQRIFSTVRYSGRVLRLRRNIFAKE